ARALDSPGLQYAGSPDRPIARVAIACGAGADFAGDAARAGADLLLTGEARFHRVLEAEALGLALVVAGHHATERPGAEALPPHRAPGPRGPRRAPPRRLPRRDHLAQPCRIRPPPDDPGGPGILLNIRGQKDIAKLLRISIDSSHKIHTVLTRRSRPPCTLPS